MKWAQDQAKQAVDLFERAVQASKQAADRYNQQAAQATEPMPPFSDPGATDRVRAQDMLNAARRQRDSAAEQAQRAIEAATSKAPEEPSAMERFMDDFTDSVTEFGDTALHMAKGAFEGVEGVIKFARSLNPMDPYNVTHPAAYIDGLSNTAAGLVHSVAHPVDLVKGLVGTGWGSDPAEALGKLLPGPRAASRSQPRPGQRAASRNRATTVWRRTMEKLFRLDARKPDEVFGDGFRVPEEKVGSGTDLINQVHKTEGDYLSTTRNTELHDQFRPPDEPNMAEVR